MITRCNAVLSIAVNWEDSLFQRWNVRDHVSMCITMLVENGRRFFLLRSDGLGSESFLFLLFFRRTLFLMSGAS